MHDPAKGQEFLEFLAEVKQDLPYSPALLQDLFSLTSEGSLASAETIADTINQEQGVATRILSLANSAFYGLQAQVTSVSRAIAVLGLKEVRNLVLMLGASALSARTPLPESFDIRAYWEHQLGAGVAARHIARRIGGMDADILFTAGLLHDFGMLLTAMYRPGDWLAIRAEVHERGIPWKQAEDEYWGLEHGLIGALTLDSWNLPHELTEPVNWHHSPSLAPEFSNEAKVICLAEALHHRIQDENYQLSSAALGVIEDFELPLETLLLELSEELKDEKLAQLVAQLT